MKIIVRTHGGFGNQIFQILYARLISNQYNIPYVEIHDDSYPHGFKRANGLRISTGKILLIERVISACRLPKILNKIGLNKKGWIKFCGNFYLDDYYQKVEHYDHFSELAIKKELIRIADEMKIIGEKKYNHLVHLRLGDFFKSQSDSQAHIIERINVMKENSFIITNQEELLRTSIIASALERKSCKLISTANLNPDDLIRKMSQFKVIDANDSTLTFWASVLGGSFVNFKDVRLKNLHNLFVKVVNIK
jgi:hypothetical protein